MANHHFMGTFEPVVPFRIAATLDEKGLGVIGVKCENGQCVVVLSSDSAEP